MYREEAKSVFDERAEGMLGRDLSSLSAEEMRVYDGYFDDFLEAFRLGDLKDVIENGRLDTYVGKAIEHVRAVED